MRLNAYGRELTIERQDGRWRVYEMGFEGKRRQVADIQIPDEISEGEVVQYLSDLLHEYATDQNPKAFEDKK